MTVLRPTPINIARLTVVRSQAMLVIEASEIGAAPSRVYDDACDVGFTIVSRTTGFEVVFAHDGEKRDGEGELVADIYKPVKATRNGRPAPVPVFSLHVLND